MSTIQLIGLAVAIVVLIVLVVTLVVTRGRGGAEAVEPPASTGSTPTPATAPGSIFDEKPRDELAELGKAVETPPTVPSATAPAGADAAMAGVGVAAAAAGMATVAGESPAQGGELEVGEAEHASPPTAEAIVGAEGAGAAGLEEAATYEPQAAAETPSVEEAPSAEEAESPVEETLSKVEEPSPAAEEPGPAVEEPSPAAELPSVAEEPPTPAVGAGPAAGVALSDIIVTTNQQQIDLEDPEVRRLIKDLIEDEIELAQQYKVQGQTVDAVLQLTEAEKACNALGLTSKARLIRAMIKELKD